MNDKVNLVRTKFGWFCILLEIYLTIVGFQALLILETKIFTRTIDLCFQVSDSDSDYRKKNNKAKKKSKHRSRSLSESSYSDHHHSRSKHKKDKKKKKAKSPSPSVRIYFLFEISCRRKIYFSVLSPLCRILRYFFVLVFRCEFIDSGRKFLKSWSWEIIYFDVAVSINHPRSRFIEFLKSSNNPKY